MRASLLAILAALSLGACKLGSSSVAARCEHVGDRCSLEEGLQGVCTVNEAARCERPPCLVCTPQH